MVDDLEVVELGVEVVDLVEVVEVVEVVVEPFPVWNKSKSIYNDLSGG